MIACRSDIVIHRTRRFGFGEVVPMKYRAGILAILAVLASAALLTAQPRSDEQSLKTAHETLFSSVKTANLTLLQAMIHPRSLGFFRESLSAVQLGPGYGAAEALPTVLTDLSQFNAVPTDTVYRVLGPVGVVLMSAHLQAPKASKKQLDRSSRATYVYISDGENWKLLSWHGSDTPLKMKK
jgi:hypothetical protein